MSEAIVPVLARALVSFGLLAMLLTRADVPLLSGLANSASIPWLGAALVLHFAMILLSSWRWSLLLVAHRVHVPFGHLTSSSLVATFFNNFLPSTVGGDVVRIADTAAAAGSKTLATTVVLIDRGMGLLALALLAALGASALTGVAREDIDAFQPWVLSAGLVGSAAITACALRPQKFTRLLKWLRTLPSESVDEGLNRVACALDRFRENPMTVVGCFLVAVAVQAVSVAFYLAIARSMNVPNGFAEMAIVVPISLIVQMLPISVNGLGVREATFSFYFTMLGLPLESALIVSFGGTALIMLFSLAGAALFISRGTVQRRQTRGRRVQM
jgi:uncharacterized protein (TIRG00374 family)